ncbi:MAG: shikimate dehydrogenase [Microbacterium sp.]|nr:shikimate dehydrogenase [Microbacterium sp.]
MQQVSSTRLAVWGDPISHSKSPQLHAAAYGVLGLDWEYGRRQVPEDGFTEALSSLDGSWRGLSLTMPLKEAAYRAAAHRDRHAEATGAVNTLLLGGDGPRGCNTDVGGIVDALAERGVREAARVRILGAGATAASALAAAAELGVTSVEVRARRPERAAGLRARGERLGLAVTATVFEAPAGEVDLTIATLPSGTELPADVVEPLAAGGVLFDAAYAPWPSALAASWGDGEIVSGFGMLLHQAVRQIRLFLAGDQEQPLPDEAAVVAAMRAAVA